MIDILAIGVHPDDIEVGCAGLLLKAKKQGLKTGILVLTKGGAGLEGTTSIREQEAKTASEIMQADFFKMLDMQDSYVEYNQENAEAVTKVIAEQRPSLVLTMWHDDQHPDHQATHHIVKKAITMSAFKRFCNGEYKGPDNVMYYILSFKKLINPEILIDITDVYEDKVKALNAHESQIDVLQHCEAIFKAYGALSGKKYAEGYKLDYPLKINNLKSLF